MHDKESQNLCLYYKAEKYAVKMTIIAMAGITEATIPSILGGGGGGGGGSESMGRRALESV
jgi:hypothetical protein